MTTRSPSIPNSGLRVFTAYLLSALLIMMPFVQLSARSRSSSQVKGERSDSGRRAVAPGVNVFLNAPVPQPAPAPFAPSIAATKTDALIGDDGDGKADPAGTEKIEYTVTITNNGSTDATNVVYTDTIDAHTTLVGGSITTQPIAVNDTYSALGNVRIQVADGASDLLNNDCDPDPAGGPCTNAGLTISVLAGDNTAPFSGTSTNGGTVTASAADGSFQYNPAPGFEGADNFTYTVTDATGKTDTATVNITVAGMIWFVNAAAAGGGDGRLTNPFNCLVGAGCFSAVAADDPGDNIFMFSGTYNDNAALVLLNNQKLIGAAATAPLATIAGVTVPTHSDPLPATGGASPVITSTATGIQLASGNLLRGFTVGNTGTAAGNYDIGNTPTATVGTLNISEVILNGTGGLFRADSGGALTVSFPSAATSSAGSNGFHLASTTGAVVIGGSGTITGVAGSDVLISGGTVSLVCSSSITHAAGANPMVAIGGGHITGTVTFTGTLNATSGTGLLFDNADSTTSYNFNGTTTLNGGDAGIDIINGSAGTFNFGGTTITNPSGVALFVSASSGAISINGAISKNTDGKMIDFDNYDTGTAAISGNLSCTSICDGVEVTNDGTSSGTVNFSGATKTLNTGASPAVNLDNNDAGNVNFTGGGLDIDTTTGAGFNAINGGTVTVTTGTNANTIDSTTGTALNVANTNIGASGLTFRSISANGGANGIVLNATGSSGGLTVTGNSSGLCGGQVSGSPLSITTPPDTADCTGGRIQNTTGANGATSGIGISLTSTQGVSLTRMRLDNHANFAIKGSSVTGLTLSNVLVDGVNGSTTSPDEGSINITNLLGTSTMTNSTVRGGFEDNISILNNTGTGTFTITGSTIRDNSTATGNDGVFAQADPTANFTLKVINSVLQRNRGDHINTTQSGNGVINSVVTGNTMTFNGTIGQPFDLATTAGGSVTLTTGNAFTGTSSFNVSNNNITGAKTTPININNTALTSTLTGIFTGIINANTIGLAGAVGSGSDGDGIDVTANGNANITVTITNNNVRQWKLLGINLVPRDGAATLNATVQGNQVGEPSNTTESLQAILLNAGPATTETGNTCANIGGSVAGQPNSFPGTFGPGIQPIRVRQRAVNTVFLPGYGGLPFNSAQVSAYVSGRNGGAGATATANNVAGAGGFLNTPGGAPCTAGAVPTGPETSDFGDGLAQRNGAGQSISSTGATTALAGVIPAATAVSPSVWMRAKNAIVDFASGVHSLIEPTAYAAEAKVRTEVPIAVVENSDRAAQVMSHHVPHRVQKTDAGSRKKTFRNHASLSPRAVAAPMIAGETVTIVIGTLRPGDSVTFTFQVTVNNPPNLTGVPPGTPKVTNQGSVTFTEPGSPVLTDDTAVVGAADPTDTPVDLFDTTTTLVSDLNPSNFGEQVTFTATVAESPTQASADPTGTVDFIDTSNGDAVICNDVSLTAGSAQCQTSSLTAGTHNTRADYSGDGNFDPSQSNIVAQVVNACTPDPIVTSTADSGAGTLREALANVCTGDTITFNIAGAGPHTITLTTGELVVDTNVIINNNSGESITVSGNNASRVFNINSGKTVSINDLTITGGSVPADVGGGIKNSGTLTLSSCNVYGNTAGIAGGISNQGTLTINNCNIGGTLAGQPNTATVNSGGGIQNVQGTLVIKNSSISGNTALNPSGAGGGITNEFNGVLTIVNSTVSNNSATQSGGGVNSIAAVTVINSTISGNRSDLSGGGINTNGVLASLTLINSTITNNRSDFNGDAVGGGGGITTFQSTTILRNTIVAGNFRGTGSTRDDVDGALDGTSSFNLIGDGTGMTGITHGTNGNQVGSSGSPIDAMLGPLASNGGPTQTHALLPTSPAIETGSNANLPPDTFDLDGDANTAEALPVDQRGVGFPRIAGSSVDIGAIEIGQADLSITKTDGVTSAVPGTSVTYTIVVSNNGPNSANGATVADTFPGILTGVTYTSVALGGATGNTATGSGNISDTLNMPSASSVTYTVNATIQSSATGNLTNTATVTAPQGLNDPSPANNSATDTDTLSPQADLSITKTDGVASKVPGTSVTYTIVVTNNGPSDANGATVADTFPATLTGVTFTSVAAGGATGNTATGSGNISNTLNMPVGSSVTYTVNATVQALATGNLTNTATVTAPGGVTDPIPANNSATDTDTLSPQADLSITKTDGATDEVPGTSITYTITVTNNGPSGANGVSVTDTFPAALTGVNFTSVAAGGATGNTTGSGNINDTVNMPVGSTVTYTVNATIASSATGSLSNTATVTAPGGVTDPTPGNNSATDTDTLTPSADVAVDKSGPVSITPGNSITYTISVTNSGPSNAVNLSFADAVPTGTTFVSVTTPAGWTRTDAVPAGGTGTITFTAASLAASATSTFTLVVNPNPGLADGTIITNTVTVASATADPVPGNNSDTVMTTVQNKPNVNVLDAQAVEPTSGSVPMLFTIALSAPAPANGASVFFSTADQSVGPGHAVAGVDYTPISPTVFNFAAGEQLKIVQVDILSDGASPEPDETFLLNLTMADNAVIVDGQAIGTIKQGNNAAGAFLISEFRTSGPGGAGDDFVEVYNNSDSPLTVAASDGSAGYGLFKKGVNCSATPILIGTIPNGTVIPARGHYLFVGSAYSLANYGGSGAAAGDLTLSEDIDHDTNIAIFNTSLVTSLSTITRLDAVGFIGNISVGTPCILLSEGATVTPPDNSMLNYSFHRDQCGKKGNPAIFGLCPSGGLPVDTNDNANDFVYADTEGAATPQGQRLGAPGPENLGNPRLRNNSAITTLLIDSNIGAPAVPNRVRDLNAVTNGANGTLSIRRRFVNNTGAPVTRLRFRIVDISTLLVPGGGIADVRALTSASVTANSTDAGTCTASGLSTPCIVTILGTTLEEPPNQAFAGGWNSTLSAGTVTLAAPLANGASINLQFLLGVQQTGSFKFFFNVEALP